MQDTGYQPPGVLSSGEKCRSGLDPTTATLSESVKLSYTVTKYTYIYHSDKIPKWFNHFRSSPLAGGCDHELSMRAVYALTSTLLVS